MLHIKIFVIMETDEDSVSNLMEKSANNSTNNNNSIQLNGCVDATDDNFGSANNSIPINHESSDSETQQNIDTQKPNFFGLIGGNRSCDSESNNCNDKTILNNNDLPISYVDDDEEANGELNQSHSDETIEGHQNNIGMLNFPTKTSLV